MKIGPNNILSTDAQLAKLFYIFYPFLFWLKLLFFVAALYQKWFSPFHFNTKLCQLHLQTQPGSLKHVILQKPGTYLKCSSRYGFSVPLTGHIDGINKEKLPGDPPSYIYIDCTHYILSHFSINVDRTCVHMFAVQRAHICEGLVSARVPGSVWIQWRIRDVSHGVEGQRSHPPPLALWPTALVGDVAHVPALGEHRHRHLLLHDAHVHFKKGYHTC